MATITGDNNDNVLSASEMSFIYGLGGNDTTYGSNFYDLIQGGTSNDVIYGNGGDDAIIGDQGSDQLYGGDGDDLIVGDNLLTPAGAGNDVLFGGAGSDRLYGNYGNDLYLYSINSGIDIINDGKTAAEFPGYGGVLIPCSSPTPRLPTPTIKRSTMIFCCTLRKAWIRMDPFSMGSLFRTST